MALNLDLAALTLPEGTEFPGTPQQLLNIIAQYMEITGQTSFTGINTGSSTPASGDRDKPWYRISGGGTLMGWYYWDGSAWSRMPVVSQSGSAVQRDALTNVQKGQHFWVDEELKDYVYTGSIWAPVVPNDVRVHYDLTYQYSQHPLLLSTGSTASSWTEIDLTPQVNAAGLNAVNGSGDPKYEIINAIVRLNLHLSTSAFGLGTWELYLKCASDSAYSIGAQDVLYTRCHLSVNDDTDSTATNICGPVAPKTGTNSIYWVNEGSYPYGIQQSIYLVGFTYKTTDAYFEG